MKIADKIARAVNDNFSDQLKVAVMEKVGIEVETTYNFLAMSHSTTKTDGSDFTQEQMDFMKVYEQAYFAALGIVRAFQQ